MRYPFPKGCHDGQGRGLKSLVVRETDGEDEENAARAADVSKKGESAFTRELFKQGTVEIVYADGERVEVDPPWDEFDRWPTKSKEFALRCFAKLNQVLGDVGEGEAVDPRTLEPTATAKSA
jgi:hypothetical protein